MTIIIVGSKSLLDAPIVIILLEEFVSVKELFETIECAINVMNDRIHTPELNRHMFR
jgi:hypothetical protein